LFFRSSSDEFDEPLRNFIKKTTNSAATKTSTTADAFANEMEDELDQIYHNFIARGTFELPISSKQSKDNSFFLFI